MMSSSSASPSAPAPDARSGAWTAPPPGDAHGGDSEQRVQYLFRHSLRSGRVHLLQHLIQRHRAPGSQP